MPENIQALFFLNGVDILNSLRLKKCIVTSILASISVILYVIGPKFPLPSLFPSFLSINFSMLPIFIAIIVIGNKYGLCIVLLRFFMGLICGTSTCGIGETADLIIGIILCLFTFLGNMIYKKNNHIIFVFIFAIIGWIIGGILSNLFALPMYMNVMGYTKEAFASMLQSIHPKCTVENFYFYYFVLAIIPFNLLLSICVVGITYLVWLPLHKFSDTYFEK